MVNKQATFENNPSQIPYEQKTANIIATDVGGFWYLVDVLPLSSAKAHRSMRRMRCSRCFFEYFFARHPAHKTRDGFEVAQVLLTSAQVFFFEGYNALLQPFDGFVQLFLMILQTPDLVRDFLFPHRIPLLPFPP